MKIISKENSISEDEIISILKTSVAYLDYERQENVKIEIRLIEELLKKKNFTLAFFAPHNSGKSTLINSLLRQPILPMDTIHSTARPISVKKGNIFKTKVNYQDGRISVHNTAEILQTSSVLSQEGKYLQINSFEVFTPYLKSFDAVEIVDLPGTEDEEGLDKIVKEYLFKSDVVIQVINAQQLFKQQEQKKIKEWLLDRGIDSIIFSINFRNRLKNNRDFSAVNKEVKKLVKLFLVDNPISLGDFFFVDAHPALEANSYKKLNKSGLIKFQAALQTLFNLHGKHIIHKRLNRVVIMAKQITALITAEALILSNEIKNYSQQRNQEIRIGKSIEEKCKYEFENEVNKLKKILSLENLSYNYKNFIYESLKNSTFQKWLKNDFVQIKNSYIVSINQVIFNISQNFGVKLKPLEISVPLAPTLVFPSEPTLTKWEKFTDFFVTDIKNQKWIEYNVKKNFQLEQATMNFLSDFNKKSLWELETISNQTRTQIKYYPPQIPNIILKKQQRLSELNKVLSNLKKITIVKTQSIRNKKTIITKLYYWMILIKLHFIYLFSFVNKKTFS